MVIWLAFMWFRGLRRVHVAGGLDVLADGLVAGYNLASEKCLGRDLVLNVLGDVPGINENSVKQQLAVLKSSGVLYR